MKIKSLNSNHTHSLVHVIGGFKVVFERRSLDSIGLQMNQARIPHCFQVLCETQNINKMKNRGRGIQSYLPVMTSNLAE
jgi:hypothetical protein